MVKWPGFREAFYEFDPERVAALDLDAIDALAADPFELLTLADAR